MANKTKKDKLAEKKAKAKAKKSKIKGLALVAILAALCGCSTSEPASRLTRADYGDIIIRLDNSRSNTVSLTIGDGAYASADSDGSTETQTATATSTPTVSPKTDVNVGGAKSGTGVLEKAVGALTGDSTGGECEGGACVYTP